MPKTIVYLRVSTDKQETANQRYEVENFCKKRDMPVDEWIEEVMSGTKEAKDRKIGPVLDRLEKGDTLIVSEISRISRNLFHVMEILKFCLERGIQIFTVKEGYVLGNDIQSKVMAFAFGIAAEIERNMIAARTREALQRKKAAGKKLGRPVAAAAGYCKLDGKEEEIKRLREKKLSMSAISRLLDCHRQTLKDFCINKGIISVEQGEVRGAAAVAKYQHLDISTAPVLYESGLTIGEIADHFMIPHHAFVSLIKVNGMYEQIKSINHKNRIDHPSTRRQYIITQ